VSVVCCQVEVSATGWSLVQRSVTECGVLKCVIVKLRKMRQSRPPRGCRAIEKKKLLLCPVCIKRISYFQNVAHLLGFRRSPGDVFMVRMVMAALAENGLEVLFILSQSLNLKEKRISFTILCRHW
jgi:hypothetical protein